MWAVCRTKKAIGYLRQLVQQGSTEAEIANSPNVLLCSDEDQRFIFRLFSIREGQNPPQTPVLCKLAAECDKQHDIIKAANKVSVVNYKVQYTPL